MGIDQRIPLDRARTSAKRIALTLDAAMPRTDGLVILAYHRVGVRTVSPVDLPTGVFRRQMAHLAARADVVGLDTALDLLEAGPDRAVSAGTVLTFDDGTADFVDLVLPILVELNLPAVLYLATAFVDEQRAFPGGAAPLTWAALRECTATGLVTIGSHTHTHALLDRCPAQVVDDELERCDDRIADELGITPAHFAYPKAVAGTAHADRAVRARYRSAALAGTRPNPVGRTDRWRLRRSPIQNADGWEGFTAKVDGGMRIEDDARRVVNLVRYRGRRS